MVTQSSLVRASLLAMPTDPMYYFKPRSERTRTCWGYTFELSPHHLQPEQARHLKYSYDTLGEKALNELNELSLRNAQSRGMKSTVQNSNLQSETPTQHESKQDLYVLLRENAASNQVLGALWKEVNTVPVWVNWPQISRGQEVFYRYGGPALTGLAFQSLL